MDVGIEPDKKGGIDVNRCHPVRRSLAGLPILALFFSAGAITDSGKTISCGAILRPNDFREMTGYHQQPFVPAPIVRYARYPRKFSELHREQPLSKHPGPTLKKSRPGLPI